MKFTRDNTYKLPSTHQGSAGDTSIFYVSGEAGTATLQLIYYNSEGEPEPFEDGLFVVGRQYKVEHGADMPMALVVVGADGATAFVVDIRSIG
jgi:hypothetical protein